MANPGDAFKEKPRPEPGLRFIVGNSIDPSGSHSLTDTGNKKSPGRARQPGLVFKVYHSERIKIIACHPLTGR